MFLSRRSRPEFETPKIAGPAHRAWYNEHRPHAALGGRTPEEGREGIELPEPIPIRATDPDEIVMQVQRRPYQGDQALPIVTIRVEWKEAA